MSTETRKLLTSIFSGFRTKMVLHFEQAITRLYDHFFSCPIDNHMERRKLAANWF